MKKLVSLIERGISAYKRRGYRNEVDYQYLTLCQKILKEGVIREGRNGNTYSLFGCQIRFDLSKGLPLLTTKKIITRSGIHELIWFLKGDTSGQYLIDNKVHIWDLWMKEDKSLPFTYPKQWRNFTNSYGKPIDQIARVIDQIKNNPHSRRLLVSAINPTEEDKVALYWCHCLFQFYVENGKLSCQLYQRSCDLVLGVPVNWLSYALLTHIIAHLCGLEVGEFIWTGGDVHIYENQIEGLQKQFGRRSYHLPSVWINPNLKSIDDIKFEDIEIKNYVSEAFIKIPVSK